MKSFDGFFGDNRHRSLRQGQIDKIVSIGGMSGYGDKESPGSYILGPVVDGADFRIRPVGVADAPDGNGFDELG